MSARRDIKVDLKLIACDVGKVYHDAFCAEFFEFQDFNSVVMSAEHIGCFNLCSAKGVPPVACLSLGITHLEAPVLVIPKGSYPQGLAQMQSDELCWQLCLVSPKNCLPWLSESSFLTVFFYPLPCSF